MSDGVTSRGSVTPGVPVRTASGRLHTQASPDLGCATESHRAAVALGEAQAKKFLTVNLARNAPGRSRNAHAMRGDE